MASCLGQKYYSSSKVGKDTGKQEQWEIKLWNFKIWLFDTGIGKEQLLHYKEDGNLMKLRKYFFYYKSTKI
jgi:hypothetical protein